jgi:uncharacterized membrane-anchored protein
MFKRIAGAALIAVLFFAGAALADAPSPTDVLKSLKPVRGQVELEGGTLALDLGKDFVYLDPKDAETLLTKVWGNPPSAATGTLGMILPSAVSADSPEGWGVILEYDNSGHVSDSDAQSIDYADLLSKMKEQTREDNDQRVKQGYESIELLGWAETPHYDAVNKTMYWAKRLRFGNSKGETLNYYIRILGRTGVLNMNVVAGLDQLAMINKQAPTLLALARFQKGSTYAEYDSGTDNTAAYGLAGLVAGGILVKAGFLKGLMVFLAGFWKVIAVGAVAVLAGLRSFVKRLFGPRLGS